MKRLHSPWRSDYIQSVKTPAGKKGCVLCAAWKSRRDDRHLVVTRGKHSFVILNLYPYNSGHCMIVPSRHVGRLAGLSGAEYAEIFRSIRSVVAGLEKISSPDGFNIGSNLGRTAGAGIDGHVHFHVVPRWNGDTNFMPVLADVKVISEEMKTTWGKLRSELKGRRR
ncbi:MAG TPA: HIT domain-containing protein [Bacteroidota bacterium]|nr:HIT domain-containing protein [Bacteroidota bacterium]